MVTVHWSRTSFSVLICILFLVPNIAFLVLATGGADGPDTGDVNGRDDKNPNGTVWGFVTEEGGDPIVGADVQFQPIGTYQLKRGTTTQAGGYYTITLPAGDWRITVKKAGYFEFASTVSIHREEVLRYDVVLTVIPPLTSVLKGKVINNDTSNPVPLATVTVFDFIRNYTLTDVTSFIGDYQMNLYEGHFLLMANKSGFLPKFIGGVKVVKDEIKNLDVSLYPQPPMDARAVGDITDPEGRPIADAKITIYDQERHFFTESRADQSGHYDFTLYGAKFVFMVQAEESAVLEVKVRNVTLNAGGVVVENFKLTELPRSETISHINLTDWDAGIVSMEMTTWGRGGDGGESINMLRFMMDLFLGNGDLYASSDEIDIWLNEYIALIKNDFALYDTKDEFHLDDIEFVFAEDFLALDIDYSGSVFENLPAHLGFTLEAQTNKTIDKGAAIHHIWMNQSYDDDNSTSETFMRFPGPFAMRDLSVPTGFTVEMTGDGQICIKAPMDPDMDDAERDKVITFDMAETVPPVADAGDDMTVEEDSIVQFNASGSTDNFGLAYYHWSFGDGDDVNVTTGSVTHIYSEPGNYTVDLTVGDLVDNMDTDQINVKVLDVTPPQIEIVTNISVVKEDIEVGFEANASDNVELEAVSWAIEGGAAGNGTSMTHVFAEPGIYEIEVTATDTSGLKATDEMTLTVTDETSPIADAGPNRTVTESEEVVFDASGSWDNVGLKTFTWNFGDGSSNVTGEVSTHKFDVPGNYTVTLKVTDGVGHHDTASAWILVIDITDPIAEFELNKTTVTEGRPVWFNASSSSDNVGIVGYHWDFGDGKNSTGMVVRHKFKEPGKYDVTLTVTDEQGLNDTRTIVIEVVQPENPLGAVCIISIFVIVFAAGIGSVYAYRRLKFGGYKVDEVFVIYDDGRLIKHISTHPTDSLDKEVIASMLTAVQQFVKESLRKERGSEGLGKIEYGKKTKIIIERGKRIYLALVLTGHDPESLRSTLSKSVRKIEDRFGSQLKKWDGDIEVFDGLDEMVIELIET